MIKVIKCGENKGYCREYYKNIDNGRIYARQKSGTGREPFYAWYSTTKAGEPDCPLKTGRTIEIMDGEQISSQIELVPAPVGWYGNQEKGQL